MWRANMKDVISIPVEEEEVEDSWELARAFAEDTRSIMGTHWPPRSYSCTFCRREFRSAQALGGHMNVHRRDRARLHLQSTVQAQSQDRSTPTNTDPTSLFYQSAICRSNNNFEVMPSSGRYTNFDGMQLMQVNEMTQGRVINLDNHEDRAPIEELDLELRLGYIPTPASHDKLFEMSNKVSVLKFR